MNKPKLLFIVPAVLIFVLSVFISCKADVEEAGNNSGSTQNQLTYYTVTYNSNSSYCKVPGELKNGLIIEAKSPLTKPFLPTLSSEFGEFQGWYYNGVIVKEGDIVSQNLTLNAKWKPNEYEIVYNCNGGSLLGTPATTYSCNKGIAFYSVKAEHCDYEFDGWYETEDFSTPKVEQWSAFTKTGKVTLYAKWVGLRGANLVNKIQNMTESGIIYVGEGNYITNITKPLKALYERDSSIRVILDCTDAGWGWIPGIYTWDDLNSSITFSELNNLSEIRLPKETKEIGRYAFRECVNLERIVFPEDLEVLGDLCFYGCKSLKTIIIPKNVTKIPRYAFWESGLKTLTIPSSITYIGECAFLGCTDFMHVVFVDKESVWSGAYKESDSSYRPKQVTIGPMKAPFSDVKLLKETYVEYELYNDKYSGD